MMGGRGAPAETDKLTCSVAFSRGNTSAVRRSQRADIVAVRVWIHVEMLYRDKLPQAVSLRFCWLSAHLHGT